MELRSAAEVVKTKAPTLERKFSGVYHQYLVTFYENPVRGVLVWFSDKSNTLSEFELYWLIVDTAIAAHKKGWKKAFAAYNSMEGDIVYVLNTDQMNAPSVFMRNLSSIDFGEIREHWLNDDYLSPKGFWIKEGA